MTAKHARFIVYILTALVGAFLVVYGAIQGDAQLVVTGAGFLGVGALAGANTTTREAKHGD